MKKHNAANERIKRKYFSFLKEAKRHGEPTVDAAAKALNRFEVYTKYRDFKAFHFEQAIAFKRHLAEQKGQWSGKKLSKAALHSTLTQLKRFFQWLALQPGYKSRIQYSDAEYFNLSDKDTRIVTTKRQQRVPTIEQIKHVISNMPTDTEIEERNRALVAFTSLTGARGGAIASMKLKHAYQRQGGCYGSILHSDTNTKDREKRYHKSSIFNMHSNKGGKLWLTCIVGQFYELTSVKVQSPKSRRVPIQVIFSAAGGSMPKFSMMAHHRG